MYALARLGPVALALASISGAACRHHGDLHKQYAEMRPAMMAGDWGQAATALEAAQKQGVYKESDRVMYWLNMGTIAHYAGDTKRSMDVLVKAESAIQELWTKSIGAEASKFVVSDTLASYPGEDYEKVLLYYYTALNRVKDGKLQDALVEARRADEFLKKMLVEFEKEEGGTLYRQDAFMVWLVGLFYEMEGTYQDAYIAYKAAYDTYEKEYSQKFGTPVPAFLKEDLARLAVLAKQPGDAAEWKSKGAPGTSLQSAADGMGEIVLIHGSGESPFKRELFIDGTMPDGKIVRIALPELVDRPSSIYYAEMNVGGATAKTELAEPVKQIALVNFKHRLPGITARAIARAIVKYVATKGAEKAAGGGTASLVVGLVGNIASAVSEAADLRGWTTLPGAFNVARLWVPAGQHELTVTYHAPTGGQVGRTDKISVTVEPGRHHIVSVRTVQ